MVTSVDGRSDEPLAGRDLRWPGYGQRTQPEPIVESQSLILEDELQRSFCAATVLRAFNTLRRQVAVRLTGSEGSFVGYDRLELFHVNEPPSPKLCVVAQVIGIPQGSKHRVAYAAYAHLDGRERHDRELDLLLAHAIGTTVVPPVRQSSGVPGTESWRRSA